MKPLFFYIEINEKKEGNQMELRPAHRDEVSLIIQFIKELASYEKMSDEVQVTEALLTKWVFEKKLAEVLLMFEDEKAIGFALYLYNFSTFLGKAGIYLEDVYIQPAYRHRGYGREVFKYLANVMLQNDLGRIEWSCLNWNQPSIDFYLKLGAKPMNEWTTFRLMRNEAEKMLNKWLLQLVKIWYDDPIGELKWTKRHY